MSYIQKLPNELLMLTFGHIDSTAQMAQCRLVCQEWNQIAQHMMLTQDLTITSDAKANQLYQYLLEHPHQAARIKHMKIDIQHRSQDDGFIRLISLAFIPHMESLTGLANDKRFFMALVTTADKYDTPFSRLKTIPYYAMNDYNSYNTALFRFKDTLESVHLRSFNILQLATTNQLPSFQKLNKIHIDFSTLTDVFRLDKMLSNCSQVEELGIHLVHHNPVVFRAQFFPWIRDSVQQNPTMKTLCIYGECNRKLVKFLMYKYPHVNRVVIDTIQCDSRWDTFNNRIFMRARDIFKIIDIIHDTPSYSIKFRLQQGSTVKAVKEHILRHGGKILITDSFNQNKLYPMGSTSASDPLNITERIHYIEATNDQN